MTEAALIERIAARGDGVTGDGRHVAGGVPGDRIRDDGIIIPGPNRTDPMCRHFGKCGGCQLQHVAEPALADFVRDRVVGGLEGQEVTGIQVLPAVLSPEQSRRRAVLTALRTGKQVAIGFNAAQSNQIVDMRMCPLLLPELFALIAPVRDLLVMIAQPRRPVKVKLQMLDQGVELILEGVKAEGLDAAMALQDFAGAHKLARFAIDQGDGLEILWQPEPPTMRFGDVTVEVPPFAFLQPTSAGQATLIEAVTKAIGDAAAVADLFAGVGTFALSVQEGRKVYAAEGARDAIAALTGAANRARALVATEHRDLFRRPLIPAELNRFGAIILDPPRAGAEEQVKQLAASAAPVIAYVSCNPASFARDAKTLIEGGYTLDWVQPVGQFRWSTHVELAARFSK
ncbi:RNA methyltransferase [Sphingopyxis sp. H038]|uniref:class I SAM-dependent RNA methyltransferase n=1 Tax=unclassified Sphingopyxis TaxID=2614943 RepID=UPI000730B452|nr:MULTISPECIES: class I SAM-dependent RNA methyltransferase [unclassified Sphingopyxis]KTE02198.1 RNA methyltransferase [Sphingopyxis sp. H012]KTE09946.1 RNA methyltransferase [Sphingopyxis sp. H053]KTE15343.1 RNA methyltransferase [Sphingopyxis sp. H093]KTE26172.1 RNA methyltransferase [Sphingopyxis sp. H080]KTE33610.1 RNA methyltransferase [Sphingopyxis sp. H038]